MLCWILILDAMLDFNFRYYAGFANKNHGKTIPAGKKTFILIKKLNPPPKNKTKKTEIISDILHD